MNFLSNVLREDGGFEYKKAIVDSILILIKDIPDAKEPGLGHLCEFIEVRRASLPAVTHEVHTSETSCISNPQQPGQGSWPGPPLRSQKWQVLGEW